MFTTETMTAQADAQPPSSSPARFSWEKGPVPLIPSPRHLTGATDEFSHAGSEMALVHNCILRTLNSIYLQAPHVPASEHSNFIKYCNAGYLGLKSHHAGEEENFFPDVERITGEKGLMDVNVEQHRAFEDGFHKWGHWIESVESKQATFDPATCISLMDEFLPPLTTHLRDEIPTLVALSKYSGKLNIRAMMDAEGEKVMGKMSKTQLLPIFFLNHDTTFEGGWHSFPPVPPPVRWFLRSICGRWNSAWWQFSTVGFDGMPRELKYLK